PAIDHADPSLVTLGESRFLVDHRSEPRPDGGTQNEGGEVSPYRSDIGAYEWAKLFACQITPAEQTRNVPPGGMTTYEITIRNLGGENIYGASGFRDQLTVRLANSSQGWATMIGGPEQTFELDWQETTTLQVQVQVPLTALVSQVENSLVTCESVTTGAEASATYTTRVDPSPGVLITPDHPQITAVPGEVITYSHTVTNIGNNDDTFELIANPGPNYTNAILVNPDGTPLSPNPFPLAAGENRNVLLRVTVLNTAPVDGIATPGAVVRSTTDPEISDAAQNSILIDFAQGPRYVAQGDTSDADNNCTVPTNPCATSQHAIGQASAGDTIFVSTGIYTDFYTQTVGTEVYTQTLFINKAITITGGYDSADEFTHFAPLTNTVRFSGEDNRRVFFVTDGVTVTLQSLFISNGQVADNGAGIYNDGANLTLKGVILENNQAGGEGAGLYQATGQLHLNSTVLADNLATGNGGGLAVADGVALLENNSFRRNESIAEGGGFAQAAGELTLYNSIFSENGSVGDASTAAFLVASPGVTVTARGFNLYHLNDGNLPLLPTDITADPLFVSAADFHLQGASPA
ncbi:MAG: hypothetical protein KDD89_12745, partial [Anaerolineales bacterium]|nr:hypothetical protein [Anaerolineales bacterium]